MRFIACADYGAGRSGPDHRAWPALGTRRCQSSGAAAQVRTGVTSGRSASGDPNGGVIYQLGIIGQAVVAFAATNIDDIVLLTAYFDQPNVRPQHVIVGQYLGFGALVGLSALGAIGVTLLPEQWAGALGLVPIALGIRGLLDRNRRTDTKPDPTEQPSSSDRDTTTATTSSAVAKVASVTFANCSDNLAVYIPLFASAGTGGLLVFVLVFLALVAVWCLVGYRLARNSIVARFLQHRRRTVVPLVLIAIGLLILIESGLPLTLWRTAT